MGHCMSKFGPKTGVIFVLVLIGALLFSANAVSANPDIVRFNFAQEPFIGYFTINCTASTTSLELRPGDSKTITFTTSADTSEIGINVLGKRLTAKFNTPIGILSVPVLYAGVVSGNIDLTGKLEGIVNVSGPGSVNQSNITWSGWGERSLTVTVLSSAKAGDMIRVTLQPYYTVDVSVSAELLSFFKIPIAKIADFRMAGSPPLIVTISVVSPPTFPIEIIIAVVFVGIVAAAIYLMRRKRYY
jgi:hypothetical protein